MKLFNHKKTIEISQYLLIGVLLFIFFVLGFYYFSGLSEYVDNHFLIAKYNFSISFIASAIEDLLFFIILGAMVFFLAMRKPEDESLETRVGYLFNGENATTESRDYTKGKINKLACISPESFIDVTVTEYLPEMKAFKVNTSWAFTLANMYSNQEYHDPDVKIELFNDDVDVPENTYGQVTSIQTVHDGVVSNHIQGAEDMVELEYSKSLDMKLPANGKCAYIATFWQYNLEDGEYFLSVARYTECFKVVFRNKTGKSIYYTNSNKHKVTREELLNNDSVEIFKGRAIPEDSLAVYLHPEDKK